MPESEVDQILRGYPASYLPLSEADKETGPGSEEPLKRKAEFIKTYKAKAHTIEHDPYVSVYFDENRQVVGKLWDENNKR